MKKIFALGFFDGVHLGHQALLTECKRLAAENGCKTGALTFRFSPAAVLTGQKENAITTLHDRQNLLKHFGIETVQVFETNQETLSVSWQDFLQALTEAGAAGFVCGKDFRFGQGGAGDAACLQAFCKEKNLPCTVVPEQQMDGEKISSTRIRALLAQGDMSQANRLLGHPYLLTGKVLTGRQLGRTMGFPTANLSLPKELLCPRLGVYACKALVDGREYEAVVNIGTRPTVSGQGVTVEAHLLDFTGDLYEKELTLHFYAYLRTEKKFASLEELGQEIRKNIGQTRKIFEKAE